MWLIRFLNGPQAGQTLQLRNGPNVIGRAPSCDIKLPNPNVSKEHVKIEVFSDKVIVTDLNSRNGTFVNGTKVRSAKVRSGDKLSLHEIIFEIQNVPEQWAQAIQAHQHPRSSPRSTSRAELPLNPISGAVDANADSPTPNSAAPWSDPTNGFLPALIKLAQSYLDRVVLPGVYKLLELLEFKWTLAVFMGAFILLVTSLSTIPLIRILKASIEEESQQHALTIATTLARINRPALMQGLDTALTVDIALKRPGVKKALIISNVDGNILAPASQAGSFPDIPFVHEARKLDKDVVKQIDDSTIVALVPIEFFNSETGSHAVTAYSVVFYDMGSLAVDNGQVLSLFITTLFIALVLGTALFYFLYRLVDYPLTQLNRQLDQALKDGTSNLQLPYLFPTLQTLVSNVNSALSRMGSSAQETQILRSTASSDIDRNRELTNLVELIGYPAMGVHSHDLTIAAMNQGWEGRTGMNSANYLYQPVQSVADQALKLSLEDLLQKVTQAPEQLANNQIEFSGENCQLVAQAVYGVGKIAYIIFVVIPLAEEGVA